MNDLETIQMMRRCKDEIVTLRAQIEGLRPKAEAYESIVHILSLLPRQGIGMGENLVWVLDQRIREIEKSIAKPQVSD